MDTEFTQAGVIVCPGGDGSTSSVTTSFKPLAVFAIAVNQDGLGIVGGRSFSSYCQGVSSRNSNDSVSSMCWGQNFIGAAGYGSTTHMFNDRCVQTYDTTSYTSPLQGLVTAWADDGFTFTWTKAITGRRVYYVAIGSDEAFANKQQNGYGVVNIGEPAYLAMLYCNYILNGHTGSSPFGSFLWACKDGVAANRGNGFSEYSLTGPLNQSAHAWGWPPIASNTAIIPTYIPWFFGEIIGTFLISNDDPLGWNFPSPGGSGVTGITWATTIPLGFCRARTGFASQTTSWVDNYYPGAIMTCGPSNGVGWSQQAPTGAIRLHGTGLGIDTRDGSTRVSLGAGQDTSGIPYSWQLDDRSWVSLIDRTFPTPSISRAGHIDIVPGSITLIDDDGTTGEDNVGLLTFGPTPQALVSFSPVTEPARRAGSYPTLKS